MPLTKKDVVMEAEQWKDRLAKEDVNYYHGREIRQRQTATKVNDYNQRSAQPFSAQPFSWLCLRGSHRPPSTNSRPPTGVSSVYFDDTRSDGGRNTACSRGSRSSAGSGRSMTSSQYGAQMQIIEDLEDRLDQEKRARLAAERELKKMQTPNSSRQ